MPSASTLSIAPFDPLTADPHAWSAFHAFRRTVAAELDPDDPLLDDAELEIEMRRPDPLWTSRRFVARDDAAIIGSVRLGFRQPGTENAADYAPYLGGGGTVLAPWRRLGVATRLIREVLALMRDLDKRLLTIGAHTDSGHAFLHRLGAVEKHRSIENRAYFDRLDWTALQGWDDGVAGEGLHWERHAGRVPMPVLESLLGDFTRLIADIPLGGLEHAPIRFEMAGYRRWYETMDRVGGAHHLLVLRDANGGVAGMCEASWDPRSADRAWQQLTAVSRECRGRGLAKALKAAMMRQIRQHHPDVRLMITGNAEVNAPMLSINRRVGFEVHRRHADYQVTRDTLDASLAR